MAMAANPFLAANYESICGSLFGTLYLGRVGDWTVFGTLYAVLYLNAQVHAVLENVTAHPDGVSRPTKIM